MRCSARTGLLLQVEMIDRFGLLPEQVKHLFAIAELKLKMVERQI